MATAWSVTGPLGTVIMQSEGPLPPHELAPVTSTRPVPITWTCSTTCGAASIPASSAPLPHEPATPLAAQKPSAPQTWPPAQSPGAEHVTVQSRRSGV
ncbi:MAG: hypothetical protein IPQ07_45010 [Myxococcales bacterium]|nr:hypothetical protein [Myxococcales bacterium]